MPAQRRRAHVTVDIFSANFRGWVRIGSIGLALVAAVVFFGFLTWRSGIAAWESVAIDERSLGLTRFPVYPGKIALCAGCLIAMLESLRQVAYLLAGNTDPDGTGLSDD